MPSAAEDIGLCFETRTNMLVEQCLVQRTASLRKGGVQTLGEEFGSELGAFVTESLPRLHSSADALVASAGAEVLALGGEATKFGSYLGVCVKSNVWMTWAACACFVVLAVCLASYFTRPYARDVAKKACHLQIIVRFIQHLSFTLVIPRSYTFGLPTHRGIAHSGLLLEVHQLGFAAGSLLMWVFFRYRPDIWRYGYAIVRLSVAFNVLGSGIFVILAHVVEGRATILSETAIFVLSARFIDGFGTGLNAFFGILSIVHLIPSEERPGWFGANQFGIMLAIGLGPMFSSLAAELNTCHFETRPLGLLGVAYLGIALTALSVVMILFPQSLEDVEDRHPPPEPPETAHPALCMTEEERVSERPFSHAAQTTALCGVIVMACLRAFVTSGLLAATSLLLVSKYHWGEAPAGVGIATCFIMFAVPAKVFYGCFRSFLATTSWIRLWSILAVVASMCLHTRLYFERGGAGNTGAWLLLIADSVLFPCLFFSDTLVGGISLTEQNLLPVGSWLSTNNMVLLRQLGVALVGRNVGPPLAQLTVEVGGQNSYAMQQFVAAILFVVLFELFVIPCNRPNTLLAK